MARPTLALDDPARVTGPVAAPARPSPAPVRRFAIRTGLIGLVLLCVVPAVIAVTALVWQNYKLREEAIYGETVLRARGLMAAVDRELARVESSLEVLASSGRLDTADLSSFVQRLGTTPRTDLVRNYVLVDRQGRQVLNTMVPVGTRLQAPRNWPELKQVFETGKPVLSGVFDGDLEKEAMLALAVPVVRRGETVYALQAGVSSDRLSALLVNHDLPAGWVASLVDRHGIIVARSREAKRFVGRRGTANIVEEAARRDEGVLATKTMEGVAALSAFSHSSGNGLWVAVGAPRDALVADLTRSILLVGSITLFLFAIGLWLALRLATSMGRSVGDLIEPALALGNGRPVVPQPTAVAEVHEVGLALAQASRMLADARYQAHHDALTGLPNRALFDELVAHQMAAARRAGQTLALLAIDLDGFKEVNDGHGHAAGDVVLKAAAHRIADVVRRGSDVVSRRGGDEFCVLLNGVTVLDAEQVAAKLVAALSEPVPGIAARVSASIGVAFHAGSGETPEALLERADAALYQAKDAGKARFVTLRDDGAR